MRIKALLLNFMLFSSLAIRAQVPYSVVIHEIMADPTPVVSLPDAEWIELKNTTTANINLMGWRLAKASSQSGPMPVYVLKPDSCVIVTGTANVAALAAFGPVISVTSFPALTNTGDLLILKQPSGSVVHAVNYTDDWYQNELKKNGGWSLEMIDNKNPCAGMSNWKASIDTRGGTPGMKNAVAATNPDVTSPQLLRAFAMDSVTVLLSFNEGLDSSKAALVQNYSISDGIGAPVSAIPVAPLFDKVLLKLSNANRLLRSKIYTINATAITDCSGNAIGGTAARVGLYERLDSLDIVINEVLFNPKAGGADYVEIYNRSNKIVDLSQAYLANKASTGGIGSISRLSAEGYLFFPGEYQLLSTDIENIQQNYLVKYPDALLNMPSMPSMNDDAGTVIVLNGQGNIIDALAYEEKWHFALITNNEGVALERIDINGPTQNRQNWHSAAGSAGYGTPGYKNSQVSFAAMPAGEITVLPQTFSPDNDGIDDFLTISYALPEGGSLMNITIFDASGRPVKYLQRNALNGTTGFYRWDGLGEKMQQLPIGMYVVYTEIFNLQGKTKKWKHTVVLARRW